jgi:hypothetical protein
VKREALSEMVIHALPDWRSHEQAFALDVSLVESVFRQLAKQRRESNQRLEDDTELDHLFFAKADVLVTLETAGYYLEKRPLLRSLRTSIACVSNEKEVRDVSGFVRHRLKEHTISCAMVKARLKSLYDTTREKKEFEQRVLHFKQQAKASSPWCVRNWKCITKSPSKFYDVYKIPPKPKTARQLELERLAIHTVSQETVASVVTAVFAKLIPSVTVRSGGTKASGRRPRSRQDGDPQESGGKPLSRARYDDILRSRARSRRNQAEREVRVQQLRLQLFAPDLLSTRISDLGFAQIPVMEADGNNKESQARSDDANELAQELLALMEANGDARLARELLSHPISRAGFRRAVEQAKNLDVPAENQWEVVKIWRAVYRTRIIQALHNAMGT